MQLGPQEEETLPASLGLGAGEGKVGEEEKLGVVGGMPEVEEMLKGVGEEEVVKGLEESRAVMAALPLPSWLASFLPQPQLSQSPLSLVCCCPHWHLVLLSLLPPPPISAPASSNMGPLPVHLHLFFGGHLASFPPVDHDPVLILVPGTTVPSSLFWPLKQT